MNRKLILATVAAAAVIGIIVLAICVANRHEESGEIYSEQETPYRFGWLIDGNKLTVSVRGDFEQDSWTAELDGSGLVQSEVTVNKNKEFSVLFEAAAAGYTTVTFSRSEETFLLTAMTMPDGTIEIMGDSFDSEVATRTDEEIIRDYYSTDTSNMTQEEISQRKAAFEAAQKAESERYEASLSDEQKQERQELKEKELKKLEADILKMTELSGFEVPDGYSTISVSVEDGDGAWSVSAVLSDGTGEYELEIFAGSDEFDTAESEAEGNFTAYANGRVEALIGNAEGYAAAIWLADGNTYMLNSSIQYSETDKINALIDVFTK